MLVKEVPGRFVWAKYIGREFPKWGFSIKFSISKKSRHANAPLLRNLFIWHLVENILGLAATKLTTRNGTLGDKSDTVLSWNPSVLINTVVWHERRNDVEIMKHLPSYDVNKINMPADTNRPTFCRFHQRFPELSYFHLDFTEKLFEESNKQLNGIGSYNRLAPNNPFYQY